MQIVVVDIHSVTVSSIIFIRNGEARELELKDHSFGAWNTVAAAGCESAGSQSHICSNCGKTESQTIAALDHLVTQVYPSYSPNFICNICGARG